MFLFVCILILVDAPFHAQAKRMSPRAQAVLQSHQCGRLGRANHGQAIRTDRLDEVRRLATAEPKSGSEQSEI